MWPVFFLKAAIERSVSTRRLIPAMPAKKADETRP